VENVAGAEVGGTTAAGRGMRVGDVQNGKLNCITINNLQIKCYIELHQEEPNRIQNYKYR
jgi:hypothetical protein